MAAADPSSALADAVADGELSGQVAGQPFRLDAASLTQGVLELRQGDDVFADLSVKIFLFLDDEGPEGKTWQVSASESGFGKPHIHVSSKQAGSDLPEVEMFMNAYDLDLRLGEYDGFELPGQLRLRIAGAKPTELNGSFVAIRDGLKLRAGKVDRQIDELVNLRWIASHWLESEMGPETKIIGHHESWLNRPNSDGDIQSGWVELDYRRSPEAEIEEARLRMIKDADGWAVHQLHDATALRPAHPVVEPSADRPFEYLDFVVARDLETRHADQPIYQARFDTSHGAEDGEVQVTYRLGSRDAEASRATYLFEFGQDQAWRLVGREESQIK